MPLEIEAEERSLLVISKPTAPVGFEMPTSEVNYPLEPTHPQSGSEDLSSPSVGGRAGGWDNPWHSHWELPTHSVGLCPVA
jgi:hypothetical protein